MKHSDKHTARKRQIAPGVAADGGTPRQRLAVGVLLVWVLMVCIIPNVALSITEDMTTVQRVANVALPLGVYAVVLSLSRRSGLMPLVMLPVMVFAAFQIVLLALYGRSPIAVDMLLNVVTTNSSEAGELLGALMPTILLVLVLYLPPLVAAVWMLCSGMRIPRPAIRRMRIAASALLVVGIVTFALSFASSRRYDPMVDMFPLNVGYNVSLAVDRTDQIAHYQSTSHDYAYDAHSAHADTLREVYVIVVGETARAENWQLYGYQRPTTPRLMHVDGLVAFPHAMSQSNTTHKSVPLMLSPLDAASYGDSIYHVKSLITAFHEAGFHTAFLSNQQRNHSYIDFFGQEADECIFIKDEAPDPNQCYDTALLPYLDGVLAEPYAKELIVLHTYGSHFNYNDRYPRSAAHFTPDTPLEVSPDARDRLINAYDNTILATSDFLAEVIGRLNDCGCAAMVYTSDHGEDIYDDHRQLFLHASPMPTVHQLHVPFIVWTSEGYDAEFPMVQQSLHGNVSKYVATSDALFHTITDIAGVDTPRRNSTHSVSSPDYQSPKPIYLDDHNKAVPLTAALL